MSEFFKILEGKFSCRQCKRGCIFPMIIRPAFRIWQYRVNDHQYHAPHFTKLNRRMLHWKDSKLWIKCCSLICLTYNLWSFVLFNRCQKTKQFQRVTESNPPGWEPVREQGRPEIICLTYQTATLGSENLRVQHFTILRFPLMKWCTLICSRMWGPGDGLQRQDKVLQFNLWQKNAIRRPIVHSNTQ